MNTLVLQDFSQVLVDTYLEPGIIETHQTERRKHHETQLPRFYRNGF